MTVRARDELLKEIIGKLREFKYPAQIAEELGTSRQRVHYWIKKLLKLGIIEKTEASKEGVCDFYRVKKTIEGYDKGFLDALRKGLAVDAHAYRCKVAILRESEVDWDRVNTKLRHWSPKYKDFIHTTIKKTTKHLIAYMNKPVLAVIRSPDDLDRVKDMCKSILIQDLKDFCGRYGFSCDLDRPEFYRELRVKDKEIFGRKIPEKMRVRDTVFKHVYPDKTEFFDELQLKNFILNRSLEEFSPDLVKALGLLAEEIREAKYSGEISEELKLLRQGQATVGGQIKVLIDTTILQTSSLREFQNTVKRSQEPIDREKLKREFLGDLRPKFRVG